MFAKLYPQNTNPFIKKWALPFATVILLGACNNAPEKSSNKSFVDIQGIDSTIRPGDNFFRYVNGKWYDTAQIPASQTGVGAYMFMNYPQRLRLQAILEDASKAKNTSGSIEQKVGDFMHLAWILQPSIRGVMILLSPCSHVSTASMMCLL